MTFGFNDDRSKNDIADVTRKSHFLIVQFDRDIPGPRAVQHFVVDITSAISNPDDWMLVQTMAIGLEGTGSAFVNYNGNKWHLNDTSNISKDMGSGIYGLSTVYTEPDVNWFYKKDDKVYIEGELYWPWDIPVGYLRCRFLFVNVPNACTLKTVSSEGTWTTFA